jgi:hypothetical protein
MRERFRSFDSKITFFAFADIITAVSGMLIFITLLLATDLGKPSSHRSEATNSQMEQQLQEALSRQAAVDAQNRSLQEMLDGAETAPAPAKLEADIVRLRAQLEDVKKNHNRLAEQLAGSQSASEARDRTLGLTELKTQIQQIAKETELLVGQESKVRTEMTVVEQRVASAESKLLRLRQREGKLWLIPDKNSTTKEPILATISGIGAKVERFDHPDQAKEYSKSSARSEFESYLDKAKPVDQYVVFLIRPSGIDLFERLVKIARVRGFEVGFDALEEGREIHFTTPPLDEAPTQDTASEAPASASPPASRPFKPPTNFTPATQSVTNPASQPVSATKSPPTTKAKSWWQRLLEFIGIG